MKRPATPLPVELERALAKLPRGLYEHVQRVRDIAQELARPLGLDPVRVDLAAAAHDIYRAVEAKDLLRQAQRLGVPVGLVEEQVPVLLHGPLAAEALHKEFGIQDPQVLEAVRWHSTGASGLGSLGGVVFLADKLDPQKERYYPFLKRVSQLAQEELDLGILEFLNQEMQALLRRGDLIHPNFLLWRNELQVKARAS